MNSSPLRTVSAVVLAAVLAAAPAAQARPIHSDSNVLTRIWSLVTGLWSKNGCRIDPDGYCIPGTGEGDITIENGCVIEPNGQCATGSPVTTKNGCRLDPDGRCIPSSAPSTENGCLIEPSGLCLE
ncbi:MAG TPA: hypothetical protein VLQ45_25260 [Thermoanaerobaculia bacterium]|nr:hypothetical protein [Thermoanaerobaculia bacterium]